MYWISGIIQKAARSRSAFLQQRQRAFKREYAQVQVTATPNIGEKIIQANFCKTTAFCAKLYLRLTRDLDNVEVGKVDLTTHFYILRLEHRLGSALEYRLRETETPGTAAYHFTARTEGARSKSDDDVEKLSALGLYCKTYYSITRDLCFLRLCGAEVEVGKEGESAVFWDTSLEGSITSVGANCPFYSVMACRFFGLGKPTFVWPTGDIGSIDIGHCCAEATGGNKSKSLFEILTNLRNFHEKHPETNLRFAIWATRLPPEYSLP